MIVTYSNGHSTARITPHQERLLGAAGCWIRNGRGELSDVEHGSARGIPTFADDEIAALITGDEVHGFVATVGDVEDRLETLAAEAMAAGDEAQAKLAHEAIAGDPAAMMACLEAIASAIASADGASYMVRVWDDLDGSSTHREVSIDAGSPHAALAEALDRMERWCRDSPDYHGKRILIEGLVLVGREVRGQRVLDLR